MQGKVYYVDERGTLAAGNLPYEGDGVQRGSSSEDVSEGKEAFVVRVEVAQK